MPSTSKFLLKATALLGALAVVFGAFGAHSLKAHLAVDRLAIYQTGVTYHFYHALALGLVALLSLQSSSKWLRYAGWAFIIGILFFSGSLYLLSTRDLIGLSTYRWLGPITPLGGLFFILGWLGIGMAVWGKE